ncbi:MAG: hypothetical protein H6797_03475 [Candidatus Nomurabacteria bacterium]|nr:MAG: hypothetical protein H6797_03475 [Candidatus Nomurabacteria bacterium]
MKETNPRFTDLNLRHIQESGRALAKFLIVHPEIDPNFVDDMTDEQEADWQQFSSDLAITQDIERCELDIELREK